MTCCVSRVLITAARGTSSDRASHAAGLTFFGFMHGEAVGIGSGLGVTPGVALAYAVVAAGLFAAEKFGATSLSVSHPESSLAVPAE